MATAKKAVKAAPVEEENVKYVNRLQKKYKEEVRPALVKEFGYSTTNCIYRVCNRIT